MKWRPEITLTKGTFVSAVLPGERRVWTQPPAAGPDTNAAGLAVFLDGEYYVTHIAAPTTVNQLQTEGRLPPFWSVYVEAGPQSRRWPDSFCNEQFASFLCEELVPSMTQATGASAERLLVGVSLTGLSAAHAALCYPGTFQRVLSHSGSFWWERGKLARTLAEYPAGDARFRLTVGRDETKTNVDHGSGLVQVDSQITGCEQMRDALDAHGFSVSYATYDGGHDMQSWRRTLREDLLALYPRQ